MRNDANSRMEYITIIGNSFDEVMEASREQKLSEREFSIVQPIGRHEFTMAGPRGASSAITGQSLVSATYARRTAN